MALPDFLDRVSVRIGVVIAWVGVPLMVVTAAAQPLARWVGGVDAPFTDVATVAFLATIMTSFGYAYARGGHVRLDILSRRFAPRVNAAIELAGTLLVLVPLCALIVIDGTESAWRAFELGERWADTALPLQWLVRAWVPIGFLLLLLAALASALRAFAVVCRR